MTSRFTRRQTLAGIAATTALAAPSIRRARAADPLTVRLDFAPWGIHAAMHLAAAKGWYEEAGLAVDIQDGKGTLNTIQLVGAGRIDVGQVQLGPMAIARENDLPVKSFAGFARKGDLAVLVDAGSGPSEPAELAGKKLACFSASPWVPFIDPYFEKAGVAGQVDVSMVAPPAMVPTFVSEEADGFMSLAPFGLPLVADSRPAKALLAADLGIAFPSYGLIATEETIAEKGEALATLAQIQVRAWEHIFSGNVEEAVEAIVARRPDASFGPKILRGQIAAYEPFFTTEATEGMAYGLQAEADWQDAIASMVEAGVISEGHQPSEYYTNALLA